MKLIICVSEFYTLTIEDMNDNVQNNETSLHSRFILKIKI